MSRTSTVAKNIVGVGIVGLTLFAIIIYVQSPYLLEAFVVPLPGTALPVWISDFRYASSVTMWVAAAYILIWYILAQWVFKVNNWEEAGRRPWWYGLWIGCFLTCGVLGFYIVPQAQSGGELGYALFFVNSALFYYLSTALFSPPSFKYAAVGSRGIPNLFRF